MRRGVILHATSAAVAIRSVDDLSPPPQPRDVLLKPSSSRMRRPSIFFSRELDASECGVKGLVRIPHDELGTALPVFSILSPTCDYYTLRIPLLKAGFKRIPSPFLDFPCNVSWGKSAKANQHIAGQNSSAADFLLPSNTPSQAQSPFFTSAPLRLENEFQKFNHFPRSHRHLGCKQGMHMTLDATKRLDFTPRTFLFPAEKELLFQHLRSAESENKKFIWKPARGSCGRGIVITRGGASHEAEWADQIREIETREADPTVHPVLRAMMSRFVVQEYIDKPLLLGGRKLDLRLYVCVTSYDPLVVYLHDKGLVRFAAREYGDGDNISHRFAHLTNYSLGRRLEKPENEGEPPVLLDLKWTMAQFKHKLDTTYGPDHPTLSFERLMSDAKRVICETLLSAKIPISSAVATTPSGCSGNAYRDNFVELYGFDIMFDDTGKAWLVEVNTLPSLESSSAMDYDTKSQVTTDLFNLSMLELFERPENSFTANGIPLPQGTPDPQFVHLRNRVPRPWTKAEAFSDIEARMHDEARFSGGFRRIFPSRDVMDSSDIRELFGPSGFTVLDEVALQICYEMARGC